MHLRVVPVLLLCLFASPAVSAQPAPGEDPVDTFFRLSGLEQQVRDLPEIIAQQFTDEQDLLDERYHEAVYAEIRNTFLADSLVQNARIYLIEHADGDYITEINAWLNSELTRRMNDLETESNDESTFQEREAYFQSLQENMPDERRLQLVERLESSTSATYYLVSVITDMYLSLIGIMSEYMDEENKIKDERMPAIRTSIMNELLPVYSNITLAVNLYTYRDVSDEDLEAYVSFYESDAGTWFADISYEVIDHVLNQATSKISN
ncbi:MAG: hypothetical protein HLUCCA01_06370 [Bacteroidetes bacterium HLUCCA01]|nr:MAG: hypothetical protein HLUCCA01_06370 [Bacteroidetes bacterium HLUCCA01]